MGVFPDVHFGYLIAKGDAVTVYRNASMFYPYFVSEVHEIIPYEKAKELVRADLKAKIAAMKVSLHSHKPYSSFSLQVFILPF